MIIHTEDLRRYTICPMMYKSRDPFVYDPFLSAIKQTLIYLYAWEMSNQKKISAKSAMAKWDSLWGKKAGSTDGWLMIQKFMRRVYNWDDRVPHLINLDYKAQWGKDFINTHFDIVLSGKDGTLTFLEFNCAPTNDFRRQLETDIEAKAKLLILQKDLNHGKLELIRYNLNKRLDSARITVDPKFTMETTKLINGIIGNIKNEIFYPSPTCNCKHKGA